MRKIGYLVAAGVIALFAAASASAVSGDSVSGTGTFTIIPSGLPLPPYNGYSVKVTADTQSGPNGEGASGRVSVQLTKKGEPGKSFQVAVNCMDVTFAGNTDPVSGWDSDHAIIGGTVKGKDKDGYRYAMFHVLTNADGGGIDWAGFAAYTELSTNAITGITAANACDQALNYTGEAGTYYVLDKGSFTVING